MDDKNLNPNPDENESSGAVIDKNLKELEKIVEILRDSTTSLDAAMNNYRKGVKIIDDTNKMLESMEKEINVLED